METARRTALVTGASAGLGAEFARQLAARGCDLVLVARRLPRLVELAGELRARHDVATMLIEADLADPDAPRRIHVEVDTSGVAVDWLVNNAGIAGDDLLGGDFGEHARFLQLMMLSVAHLCHLFVPPMQRRGFGRVVNVASVAGRVPRGGDCNYGPSKAYVVALSEALHLTVRRDGVNVCALCPGFTHTEFHEAAGMMDMKRATPAWLWYDADVVVREGLRAVDRGKPVWVSGRLYRLVDPFLQSVWTRRFFRFSRRHVIPGSG
jgi:uncharacterized protein